jgi:uncharacterized membrane protein YphA (DoxX/SURF4 family)
LDGVHATVKSNRWLGLFTWFTRVLLAVGFIPPGLTKLSGHPFTALSTDTPIGYFFDAFHQTGLWYGFVGACQVAAGLLLLTPWTAALGAVVYFPIILNIFVVTISMDFGGTPVITGLMLLANTYLLCWDYDRLKHVLIPNEPAPGTETPEAWKESGGRAPASGAPKREGRR